MSALYFDIEADGLDPTEIFTCVFVDEQDNAEEVRSGWRFAARADKVDQLIGHNIIGYDCPQVERLWRCTVPQDKQVDTLVLSRLAFPGRPQGHSLDSWGEELGYPKGSHSDFTQYSPEMLEYCERDTRLTKAVHLHLMQALVGYGEDAIELEHSVYRVIRKQIDHGWLLDEKEAWTQHAELKDEEDRLVLECHETFKPIPIAVGLIEPKYKQDGEMSAVGLKPLYGDDFANIVGGPFTRLMWQEFNLGSRPQIAERLQRVGWVPVDFTDKGNIKVDDEVLKGVDIPEARLIQKYFEVSKRRALIAGWLKAQDPETGRVHGFVDPNGAVTGRMTHSSPNIAQTPGRGDGKITRKCWTVPEGYKLVGCDADGLELRMLAHYMKDEGYIKAVAEGRKEDESDVHNVNKRAAGLTDRDTAKTFIYAFLYGAGDLKIGRIAGTDRAGGRALKQRFLDGLPALKTLKDNVGRAARRGWLLGLDGRRIKVRSAHAALNTLLQGAGAVIMKRALVILDALASAAGLVYNFVGNIHDEFQAEVLEKDAEAFARLAEEAIVKAGEWYGLRIPLAGQAHIGTTWYDTH